MLRIASLRKPAGRGGLRLRAQTGAKPEPAEPSQFALARFVAGVSQHWPTDRAPIPTGDANSKSGIDQ